MRFRRSGRASFAVVSVIGSMMLVMTGCTAQSNPSSVSDQLKNDSAQFQLADGLFEMPEATASGLPSEYAATTAYVEALGCDLQGVVDWHETSVTDISIPSDLVGAESYLLLRHCAGSTTLDPSLRATITEILSSSHAESEPGAEVGALWTWAHARSLFAGLQETVAPDPGPAVKRLQRVTSTDLSGHPYLVWRVAEIYKLLGLSAPPWLDGLAKQSASVEIPTPTSTIGLLDGLAILKFRQLGGRIDAPSAYIESVTKIVLNAPVVDDLSRASLLQVLAESGSPSASQTVREQLKDRLDSSTGLLKTSQRAVGTVEATFLFARLLDTRFGEVASVKTRDRLYVAASDSGAPMSERLRAGVALKYASDPRWKSMLPLAQKEAKAMPAVVREADLDVYLSVMEPAIALDSTVERGSLEAFDPGEDEIRQKHAWAAINLAYLFSNEDAVCSMFPNLQATLKRWAESKDTEFPQLVEAAEVIPILKTVSVDSTFLEQLAQRIVSQRGCKDAASLYSIDGTRDAPCSLILTLQIRGIPGTAN